MGARVLVIYSSANRDEREWDDPDTFDIRSDANRHLGFGQGAHACAGQALARLETSAMLRALVERVGYVDGRPSLVVEPVVFLQSCDEVLACGQRRERKVGPEGDVTGLPCSDHYGTVVITT